jgi:hypothetical protein
MTAKKGSQKRQHEGTESVSVSAKAAGTGEMGIKDNTRKVPVNNLQDIVNPGRVRVEASVTKNMGNYESIRVGVAIEWPCEPTPQALKSTYEFLSDRAEALVLEELELAKSGDYLN